MVEHVLAKDETGVRFSLAAHLKFYLKLWITMLVMFIKDMGRSCLLEAKMSIIRLKIRLSL